MFIAVIVATIYLYYISRVKIDDYYSPLQSALTDRLIFFQQVFSIDQTCWHLPECDQHVPRNVTQTFTEAERMDLTYQAYSINEEIQQKKQEKDHQRQARRNARVVASHEKKPKNPRAPKREEENVPQV